MTAQNHASSPHFFYSPGFIGSVLVVAISIVPLWSANIPPLLDYHNHLARQYILANLANSEALQTFYSVEWRASPYLAFDAIVQLLAGFLPVATAGKIFVTLTLLMLASAPMLLSRALYGRVTLVSLVGLLFAHNMTVTLGFVNYLFSIGFAVCLFALWVAARNSGSWVRLLAFPVLASLLFFSHLIGFMIYVLLVAAYEFGLHVEGKWEATGRKWLRLDDTQKTGLLSLLLQCAIPMTIFVLYGPSSENVGQKITYGGFERKLVMLGDLFFYLIPAYSWTLDKVVAAALSAALVLAAVFRRITVKKSMLWSLLAMLVFYFAMPMELFGGWGADQRLLPVLGMLLAGSIRPKATIGSAASGFLIAVISALVVVRVAAITVEWRKANTEVYAEYLSAFDSLRDGSTVFFAFGHSGPQQIWPSPVYHLPQLALAKRDVYMPYLFVARIMPLKYDENYRSLQRLSKGPVLMNGRSPDWAAIERKFDYYLLVNERFFDDPPPKDLMPVFVGERVKVYRYPD